LYFSVFLKKRTYAIEISITSEKRRLDINCLTHKKGESDMKKIFLVTILLLFSFTSYAGQKAITDTGDQVILNSDGT
jgi:hypothetical protein